MSTDIKPGQVWAASADPEETYRVIEVRHGHVWSENRYGGHAVISATLFPNGRHLVEPTPAPDPEPVLPTTVGSVVLVRNMGGHPMALQLRPDTRRKATWMHAIGSPWVEPIVRDHLIEVLFDAGAVSP